MINTVTIPVSEYDNLRKQREEVIRLKEIKEPVANITLIQRSMYFGYSDEIASYSVLVSAKSEEVNKITESIKNDLSSIFKKLEADYLKYTIETSAALTRAKEQVKRRDAKLYRIPNWIKRHFI